MKPISSATTKVISRPRDLAGICQCMIYSLLQGVRSTSNYHRETERAKAFMRCEDQHHTSPLLSTKLHRPALTPRLVPRARLLHRLSSGLQGRLTLISAAAGSGKTTLLCEWIDSLATEHYAWLALEEDDNDPVRFWHYLLTALATLSPGLDTQLLPLLPRPRLYRALSCAQSCGADGKHSKRHVVVKQPGSTMQRYLPAPLHTQPNVCAVR